MMRITGTDTPAGKASEQAYMVANASSPCQSCDAIGRTFSTCQCGNQFMPVKNPVLTHLPLWS